MELVTDHAPGCDRDRVVDAAPGQLPAWPSCRQDGSREQREESDREIVHCRGGHTPGWVHSFAVTEKYIVVLKSQLTPWYIFDWLPESGSYMYVICKFSGRTVRTLN